MSVNTRGSIFPVVKGAKEDLGVIVVTLTTNAWQEIDQDRARSCTGFIISNNDQSRGVWWTLSGSNIPTQGIFLKPQETAYFYGADNLKNFRFARATANNTTVVIQLLQDE